MRELERNECVIQLWSSKEPNGDGELIYLVDLAVDLLKNRPELGVMTEREGPTAHIPDYFSDLYGTVQGWLVYVANSDPLVLKKVMMELENSKEGRIADIDIFTSYFDKISRKDLK